MSHWKSDHPSQLEGFQITMYQLVTERFPVIYPNHQEPIGPSQIAKILYENYYEFVAPRGYPKKHTENYKKNYAAIKKSVERDFNKINPWEVSSSYMYAYSKLFHVSMDFLYGNEPLSSDDYDVRQICKRTGLSEKAVENLVSNEEVYICDFAYNDFAHAIDEDYEYESVTTFWSNLLESDLFTALPQNYYRMACSSYFYKLCKHDEHMAHYNADILPSKKDFIELVDEFYSEGHDVFTNNMSLDDVYEKDKDLALEIIRDINHWRWYEINENLEKMESVYWGCLGQFDRFIQNYFHNKAESYKIKLYSFQEEEP